MLSCLLILGFILSYYYAFITRPSYRPHLRALPVRLSIRLSNLSVHLSVRPPVPYGLVTRK